MDIRNLLVKGELISAFSYGSGFPALMPRGVDRVRQFQAELTDCLRSSFGLCRVMDTPLLIDAAEYEQFYGQTYDYSNVFYVRDTGQNYVVRPDGLIFMLPVAREVPGECIVSTETLFRYGRSDCAPLVKDQALWGVVQAVTAGTRADESAILDAYGEALMGFFSRLLLPTILVDAGSLREHARQRYLSYSLAPDGKLYLTSTLYSLGSAFMADGEAAVELGISAKVLALAIQLCSDDSGPSLPLSLTEVPSDAVLEPAEFQKAIRTARRIGHVGAAGAADDLAEVTVYSRARGSYERMAREDVAGRLEWLSSNHDEVLWDRACQSQEELYRMDGKDRVALYDDSSLNDLGRIVASNYDAGREAADSGKHLFSARRRLH